jgi:hypothetical protein
MTTENPNKAHGSNIGMNSEEQRVKRKLYSPMQAMTAAFCGGPIAVAYMLKQNFEAMNNAKFAYNSMVIGLLISLALVAIIPFIPEEVPNISIGMVWIVITHLIMNKYQLSKDQIVASSEYEFQSNWSVVAVSLLAIVCYFMLLVAWFVIAEALGLIEST